LLVIDEFHFNGGLLFKKTIGSNNSNALAMKYLNALG
jgi:hypothetical protein